MALGAKRILDKDSHVTYLQKYIFGELELLILLGYDLKLKNIVEKKIVDDGINYFVKFSTEKNSFRTL